MDVLSVCPLLLCQNKDQSIYEGFLSVKGQHFLIHVDLGCGSPGVDGKLSRSHLHCEWKLYKLLEGYQNILQQRLRQSNNLAGFLVELKSIVERRLEKWPAGQGIPTPPAFYNQLIQEIQELGWNRLAYIDSNFHELHLQAVDTHKRRHLLKLQLNSQHPLVTPKCQSDLPAPFQLVWSTQTSSLVHVYRQFESQLEIYQEFWNMLDEIDQKTWVLEPEQPNRSAASRRIALGNNASIQIEVAVSHPRMLPECRFLGADHVINPLKESLNRNLHKWSTDSSLLCNLHSVLGIHFPSPQNTKKEDFSVDCGICYAYRLDGAIPDQVCDDSRCNQPFHQACLYEWLRALPSSRQSFNTVFGECPYCSKPITVKMPTR